MDRINKKNKNNILFLNQLPHNFYDNDLKSFFNDYENDIIFTKIDHTFANKTAYDGYTRAIVVFKTPEKAKHAFNNLSMKRIRGNTVNIQYHKSQVKKKKGYNIFVKGLPTNIPQRKIFEKFLEYGDIISSKLCEDAEGNHLGYGYFNYANIESVSNLFKDIENNVKFFGVNIQVAQFQKKNNRDFSQINANKHKNIYIKNISPSYTKEELINKFKIYGNIEWCNIKLQPERNSQFAIITYSSELSAKSAIEAENNKNGLYVDYLQTKAERSKLLSNKIYNSNLRLNEQYNDSNLHIRNLPKEINEEILAEILNKFGDIKSLKIPKFRLVSKVNNKIQEITQNKLFCYVCFENIDSAKNALKGLNGVICPGFEKYINRPLIVEYFMPKVKRLNFLDNIYNRLNNKAYFFYDCFEPGMFYHPLYLHPNLAQHVISDNNNNNYNNNYNDLESVKTSPNIDRTVFDNIKDEKDKKDYLGEIIFGLIDEHPLKKKYNFNIDSIGKITGMILGIQDFNLIIQIINDYDSLTSTIKQALQLLELDQK